MPPEATLPNLGDNRVAKNMGARERKTERAENKNPGGGGDTCNAWVGPTSCL